MWVPLAIVTAVAFAASGSYAKALSRSAHIYVLTWVMLVLSVPWSMLLLIHQGLPPVGEKFFLAALVSVALNMVAVTMQIRALSLAPLSLTVPFLAFTPLFMLATSAVVLGESPDAKGLAGIVLVATGAYTVYLEKIRGGFLAPLKAVASERGSRLMLIVALIWSCTAVCDKIAVLESSPAFYATFSSVTFGVAYLPFLVLGLRRRPIERRLVPRLLLLGTLSAVMILSQLTAIELTMASYVIAIKRAGIVVSVVFGYVFFKEKHLRARLAGAFLMTVGAVLLSV